MLHVVMYHYVRDFARTAYPRIKGMELDDFRQQVNSLADTFEMGTLESCLDYLGGRYVPKRDLCLLTFDDGLKEHFAEVTPVLQDSGIQGVFAVITACLEDHIVVPVHMNHFLMASLEFDTYREAFIDRLSDMNEAPLVLPKIDPALVRRTYPWDTHEVASFKYFFNFQVDTAVRDLIVKLLFEEYVGPSRGFAEELYVSWEQARQMQGAGMAIGGHTHQHRPLACLSDGELKEDLETCSSLLRANLSPQSIWPFCYPYGKSDSFQPAAVDLLKQLGFACSFTTETGSIEPLADPFRITRFDCKKAPTRPAAQSTAAGGHS